MENALRAFSFRDLSRLTCLNSADVDTNFLVSALLGTGLLLAMLPFREIKKEVPDETLFKTSVDTGNVVTDPLAYFLNMGLSGREGVDGLCLKIHKGHFMKLSQG